MDPVFELGERVRGGGSELGADAGQALLEVHHAALRSRRSRSLRSAGLPTCISASVLNARAASDRGRDSMAGLPSLTERTMSRWLGLRMSGARPSTAVTSS